MIYKLWLNFLYKSGELLFVSMFVIWRYDISYQMTMQWYENLNLVVNYANILSTESICHLDHVNPFVVWLNCNKTVIKVCAGLCDWWVKQLISPKLLIRSSICKY